MDPITLMMLLGGITSGIGTIGSIGTSMSNMNAQRQTQQYNRDLQQQIFDREDNAVQRRVADLEKAGFSKWNAITNPAATTTAFSEHSAPQANMDNAIFGLNSISQMMFNAEQMKSNVKQNNANIDLLREKIKTETLEQLNKVEDTELKKLMTEKAKEDVRYQKWHTDYEQEMNRPTDEASKSSISIGNKLLGIDATISLDELKHLSKLFGISIDVLKGLFGYSKKNYYPIDNGN